MARSLRVSAFTLIELVITIAVIAVLVALLVPAVATSINDGQLASAAGTARRVHDAVLALVRDTGRSPRQSPEDAWPSVFVNSTGFAVNGSELNVIAAGLQGNPPTADPRHYKNWHGPYIDREIPLDPWRREFRLDWDYRVSSRDVVPAPNPGVAFLSLGPDGTSSADDLRQYFKAAF